GQTGLGLELGEQAVDVVDVLGTFDLRDHDHVERRTGVEHGRGQVVETPRRVEAVDPRPELGVAEVDGAGGLDEPGPGGLLVGGRYAVLEVGEQHVDGGREVGQLAAHLLVVGREEVDDPARPHGDLAHRGRSPDGE